MALVVYDRVKETTTTTGTGTITLAGAVTGYRSFAVVGNGNTTYYCIAGRGTNEWEVGIGTYTAAGTTLARTTILASSNANTAVNFSAGTKDVFVTPPAGKYIGTDGGTLTGGLVGTTGSFSSNLTVGTGVPVDPSNVSGFAAGNISESSTGFSAPGIVIGTGAGSHGAIVYGGNTMYFGTENGSDNTLNTRATLSSTGAFNTTGAITQNSSQVLTAGNYSSYALPLSGGTLTGNLLIAQASSPYTYYIQFGDNTGWKFRFMTSVSGTPTERFSFTDNGAFNAVGAITQNGSQVLTAANYTSYSPSLTGTGASGSWNISVTGSAANATTANNVFGGAANRIPYNTAANTTSFVAAPTTASTFLQWTGSAFTWAAAGGGPTQGTAQNTTSGTSITFTGLPSTLKRITLMFNSISTTGTNPFIIQLGTSSGFVTTGYASTGSSATTGVGTLNTTAGLIVVASPPSGGSGATGTYSGLMTIAKLDSTIWTSSASLGQDGINHSTWAAGRGTISGTVTQLRLTTTTGVDTWDSGSINILYE